MSREHYGRWMSTFQGEENMGGQHSFDELSRALAAGTISRGRALKLAGAALLGSTGLLSLFPSVAEAQQRIQWGEEVSAAQSDPGCQGEPAINNRQCPANRCRGRADCFCAVTAGGNKRCVEIGFELCPRRNQCNTNEECPQGEICVKFRGCCPDGGRRNVCVSPCD